MLFAGKWWNLVCHIKLHNPNRDKCHRKRNVHVCVRVCVACAPMPIRYKSRWGGGIFNTCSLDLCKTVYRMSTSCCMHGLTWLPVPHFPYTSGIRQRSFLVLALSQQEHYCRARLFENHNLTTLLSIPRSEISLMTHILSTQIPSRLHTS